MQLFEIKDYLEIAYRRLYWVLIPFLVTILAGLAYALTAPKMFESTTLILVQEQRVPQHFVKPILTSEVEDRLRTISQQVTSRTNLETIINTYNVLAETSMAMEQKVETVRKRIRIDVASRSGARGGGNAFSIIFQDPNPERAMRVASALASNFISENLKVREEQALGTSDFLAGELDAVKRKLAEKEAVLQDYRSKFMGGMPEHLTTNLAMLNRLQLQMEQLNKSLSDAENRKLIIQQQIAQTKAMQSQMADLGAGGGFLVEFDASEGGMESEEEAGLRRQLKALETRYTENHPDVVRIKKMLAKIEAEKLETQDLETSPAPAPVEPAAPAFAPADFLTPQLDQVNLEIRNLRAEVQKAGQKMAEYQQRVEDTPKREQELTALTRDYVNLQELHKSLLDRKLESELAVSMERKQKGEQFRVIDPAKIPEMPVAPNIPRIILLSIVLGLGLGAGIGYLMEMTDTSFRKPEDIEKELKAPVLLTIPIRQTEESLKKRKRRSILAAVSVASAFVFCAAGIMIAAKGVDGTMRFFKSFLGML